VTFTENEEKEYPSTWGAYAPARHEKRANLGFGDGHAAAVAFADFYRNPTANTNSIIEFSQPRVVYWWPYPAHRIEPQVPPELAGPRGTSHFIASLYRTLYRISGVLDKVGD